jgi:hypothetical protein
MKIVEKLQNIQGKATDDTFARILGISRVHWNRIRHGRRPGRYVLNRVGKIFPDLQADIDRFLSADGGNDIG